MISCLSYGSSCLHPNLVFFINVFVLGKTIYFLCIHKGTAVLRLASDTFLNTHHTHSHSLTYPNWQDKHTVLFHLPLTQYSTTD